MLHSAIMPIDDEDVDLAGPTLTAIESSQVPVLSSTIAGRYGRHHRPNIAAILLIALGHAVVIGVLIHARTHVAHAQKQALTVVNLSPPPPPPAAETPPPPPSAPQVVAPPPIVQTPAPVVAIQTSPEPIPVAAMPMPAPPSPMLPVEMAAPAPPSIVQGGDLGAQMIAGKPPRYPTESRRKREQGTVVLSLTVGLDGAVETIAIAQSSGFHRLDDAARAAVKGWRWKPFLRSGQPMKVRGEVEIPFVLRGDS